MVAAEGVGVGVAAAQTPSIKTPPTHLVVCSVLRRGPWWDYEYKVLRGELSDSSLRTAKESTTYPSEHVRVHCQPL